MKNSVVSFTFLLVLCHRPVYVGVGVDFAPLTILSVHFFLVTALCAQQHLVEVFGNRAMCHSFTFTLVSSTAVMWLIRPTRMRDRTISSACGAGGATSGTLESSSSIIMGMSVKRIRTTLLEARG